MLIFLTINSPLNLAYGFFLANVIDLRKTKKSLVDICMDETGGLGVDCVIDNGGNCYFSIYLRLLVCIHGKSVVKNCQFSF